LRFRGDVEARKRKGAKVGRNEYGAFDFMRPARGRLIQILIRGGPLARCSRLDSFRAAMRFRTLLLTVSFFSLFSFSRAEPLAVGDAAPAISATTETGATLDLGDVYAKGMTLVYFYPKAGTAGCTAQGCSLRDAYAELTKHGVTVIGVSTDTVEAQKKFKDEQHFPFTLIADTDKKVMHAFGQEGMPAVGLANRQAFLINKEGKIVWRDLKASTKQQADDVLAALKQLGD